MHTCTTNTQTCIHAYIYMPTHIHTCIHTFIEHTYKPAYIYTCIHACIHTYVQANILAYEHRTQDQSPENNHWI